MSARIDKECDKVENNENVAVNGCDGRSRNHDVRDCSGSQELFSDDDHIRDSTFSSPKVATKNDTLNSSTISLKTPILCSKVTEETPGRAAVPRTPADLLPFIRKTSILWTSDMETPDKLNDKPEDCDQTINSNDISNTTPHRQQKTPNYEEIKMNKTDITSPVLGGKKRSKRKVKRRILNNVVLDLDNNNDQQSSISSNSDKVPSEAAGSVSNELALDIQTDANKLNTEELGSLNNREFKENKKLEEVTTFDKNSNTSTQDFFCNASFSSIDRLCKSIIQEETNNELSNTNECKLTKNGEMFKKETDVSNDVLARVAAIKRNQKPLRRSTDISNTVIPREVFHKSVIEQELAEDKFNEDNRKLLNKQQKFSQLTSFVKLSALENELNIKKEKPFVKKEEINSPIHEVPAEIMDDWNTDNALDNELKEEKLGSLPTLTDISVTDENTCTKFFSASGKTISINEKNLQKFIRIYNEIENEISDNNDFLTFKKSNTKDIASKPLVTQTKSYINLLECKTIPISKDNIVNDATSSNGHHLDQMTDGFETASGKTIIISEDKIFDYAKIYNEIENENLNENTFLGLKNSTHKSKKLDVGLSKHNKYKQKLIAKVKRENNEIPPIEVQKHNSDNVSKKLKLYQELDLQEFLEPKSEMINNADDSFKTASGKNIKINEEKENYYSKIYNELDEVDNEKHLLNITKNKVSKLNSKQLRNDKTLIIFNENKINSNRNVLKEKNKIKLESFAADIISDGFSTAAGERIKIDEKKESFYSKIYSELSEDIQNEHCFLAKNKNESLKVNRNFKPVNKSLLVLSQKQTNNVTVGTKFSVNCDSNEAFYDLGQLEKLITSVDQVKTSNNIQSNNTNCFTIPSSTHVLKKVNHASTDLQNIQNNVIKNDGSLIKSFNEMTHKENNKNQGKSYIGTLKRKLDSCEVKKPERSRSFGGFAINNEGISVSKLNKSDPNDESFVNQPLKKGLSVSQCFDSHSDSLLSKVELSYLNNSKTKSPDVTVEKIQMDETKEKEHSTVNIKLNFEKSNEFLGFSFEECTNSFRRYVKVKKFLKMQHLKHDDNNQINIEKEETVSIIDQTLSDQQLIMEYTNDLEIKKNQYKSNYVLTKCKSKPKRTTHTIIESDDSGANNEHLKNNEKLAEKRKHADTDSDTPLTIFKKPRVGSELHGRKLFSDESDTEDYGHNIRNQVEVTNNVSLVTVKQEGIQLVEEDLSEQRFTAILQQEKIIRNKKRMRIKPVMGSILRQRLANSKNRISWAELIGNSVPGSCCIKQIQENKRDIKILGVTASNATCYTFLTSNIVENKKTVSLDLGDGALLIFDDNGHAGVSEFTDAFLAMPGVDPKLLPTGWVENHYRWIIWKLASMDRIHFNSTILPKMLTPERVMKELKYRYDREIDRAERPPLRKILEKDDVPSRRMVLCISSIKEATNTSEEVEKEARTMLGLPRWKIEATDGWYSIPLTIDTAMSNYISDGKLKEGTKIVTYGAELLNCERGFYPLEKPADVSLKIYTNCTRRAKWDTKLGYQKSSRPIPVKLRNIVPNGGMIGETTAVAARVYPILYREKTAEGQSIYRNARTEEKAAIAHERALELKVDAIYAEAQRNLDSKKKSDSDEEIENSQVLTESQTRICGQNIWEKKQEQLKEKLEMKVRQGLPPPRQVTPVLKIRLVDDKTTVILTIWGASEDSGCDIKEGNTITIYNSFAMGSRGGELNLTANRVTHIKTEPLLRLPYPSRTCTLIPDMMGTGFEPKFCEFDTVGVVVSTGPAPYGMKNFEMVNLAYPKLNDAGSAYLSILFWSGVSSFGYQSLFTMGTYVACSNLEWRRNTSWSIAVAYCAEKTVFTSNPRQQHLASELRNLKTLVQNPVAYAESCVEEVTAELSKKPQLRSNQGTPTSCSGRTSFANNSPSESISPGNAMIQRRLEMLSRYGNSPDVSPIVLNNSSARVKKDFTPVTRKT